MSEMDMYLAEAAKTRKAGRASALELAADEGNRRMYVIDLQPPKEGAKRTDDRERAILRVYHALGPKSGWATIAAVPGQGEREGKWVVIVEKKEA